MASFDDFVLTVLFYTEGGHSLHWIKFHRRSATRRRHACGAFEGDRCLALLPALDLQLRDGDQQRPELW